MPRSAQETRDTTFSAPSPEVSSQLQSPEDNSTGEMSVEPKVSICFLSLETLKSREQQSLYLVIFCLQ